METDKRIETLEREFKLMKGELKQTLTSVRDYLLTSKLPDSEYTSLLSNMGAGDSQQVVMEAKMIRDSSEGATAAGTQEPIEELQEQPEEVNPEETREDEETLMPEESEEAAEEQLMAGDEPLTAGDESLMPGDELPEEPMTYEKSGRGVSYQSTPPANLLANLIRWVSSAKKEIGREQLPIFLEVYGISGYLSPEMKEVILHLLDITAAQSVEATTADVWSRLILELHGILTGAEAPLHPVKPVWDDNDEEDEIQPSEPESDRPEHEPLKLKLVLPGDDGTEREFSFNLSPEAGKENLTANPSTPKKARGKGR